jgi:hypothetical protein
MNQTSKTNGTAKKKGPANKPGVATAMAAIEVRLDRLEEVSDKNVKAAIDAIQMLELQNRALRRVIEDLMHGRVRANPDDCASPQEPGGAPVFKRVDWNGYLKTVIEELATQEQQQAEEKAGPGPVLASAHEETIVFGG